MCEENGLVSSQALVLRFSEGFERNTELKRFISMIKKRYSANKGGHSLRRYYRDFLVLYRVSINVCWVCVQAEWNLLWSCKDIQIKSLWIPNNKLGTVVYCTNRYLTKDLHWKNTMLVKHLRHQFCIEVKNVHLYIIRSATELSPFE